MGIGNKMETFIKIVMITLIAITKGETDDDLKEMIESLNARVSVAEEELTRLRDMPYMHTCGWRGKTFVVEEAVWYENIFYDSTNMESGGLDWESGVFTAGHPGTYTISWSLMMEGDMGDKALHVVLRKNGIGIDDTFHESYYNPSVPGSMYDQGGRTVLVGLEMGDTLDIYCIDCSSVLWYLTFCVSLTTPDTV